MQTPEEAFSKVIPEALASMDARSRLLDQAAAKAERDFLSANAAGGEGAAAKAALNEQVSRSYHDYYYYYYLQIYCG